MIMLDIIYIYHIHNKRISLLDLSLWYSSTDARTHAQQIHEHCLS